MSTPTSRTRTAPTLSTRARSTRTTSALIALAVSASACSVLSDETATKASEGIVIDASTLRSETSTTSTPTTVIVEVLGRTETAEVIRYEMVGVPRGLNLRRGPGAEFAVVVGVEKNRIVEGTGRAEDGWIEVRIDDNVGWMSAPYLQPTDEIDPGPATTTDSTTATTAPADLVVIGVPVGLNLRSGPGSDHDVVGGAVLGATVQPTGDRVDGWIEVTHDGVTGWADGRYLRAD